MAKKRAHTLFSPGKARWLMEHIDQLDEGDRALLLALAELSKGTGRELTEEEHTALDKLAAETHEFPASEIQGAVHKMVKGKTTHQADQDWSEVSRRLKKARKK